MPDRRYSAGDVRRAVPHEAARDLLLNQWPIHFALRGAGFHLAATLLNAGIHPNTVTLASLLLALVIPIAALGPLPAAALAVAALGIVIMLLDLVDGNMARTLNATSARGASLDFTADTIYRITLCLGVGLLARTEASSVEWLVRDAPALGLAAAAFALAARGIRMHAARESDEPEVYAIHLRPRLGVKGRLFCFIAGLDYTLPLLIALFGLFEVLHALLIGLVMYFLLDLALSIVMVSRRP